MLIYSSAALISIICGFIYAHHVLGCRIEIKDRVLVSADARQYRLIFCVFLLCGLVLLAYIRQVGTIALFEALKNNLAAAAVARSKMGNDFVGKYWRYQLFFRYLLDYCVLFFFANYLIKHRRISLFIFGGSFLVAAFSATMAIEKGPITYLLIMLFLTYVIYKGGNYWQLATKYAMVMIISILIGSMILTTGYRGIPFALQLIISRVFTGQITPAYFYLYLFPLQIDYLWGASFPNPGGLLPFQNYALTMNVSNYMFPGDLAYGVVGSAPTVFWGEMYANFGPIGIIVSAFLVGIGLFAVTHILSKLPQSPTIIAATVSLAMHYMTLAATGLSSYFFDTTLVAIAAVTFMSLLLRNKKFAIHTKNRKVYLHGKQSTHRNEFV